MVRDLDNQAFSMPKNGYRKYSIFNTKMGADWLYRPGPGQVVIANKL